MEQIEFKFNVKKSKVSVHGSYGRIRSGDNIPYGIFSKYGSNSAIYGIKNIYTKKQYIGSTINIQRRLLKHFNELFHNRHRNKRLQEDFNTYGFISFEIIIYENKPNKSLLLKKEKDLQIKIGIDNLYNEKISGFYIAEEYRKQLSNSSKNTHKTKEYRNKMSKLKTNKIRQYDLDMNPIKDWDSAIQIVETLGYTRSVILGCCNGSKKHAYNSNWRYINDKGNIVLNGYEKGRQYK